MNSEMLIKKNGLQIKDLMFKTFIILYVILILINHAHKLYILKIYIERKALNFVI